MWRGLVVCGLMVCGIWGAAARPAVAVDRSDELEYLAKVGLLSEMMGDGLTEFGEKTHLYQADITDDELMAEVVAETGVWEAVYDIAMTIDPPDGYAFAHHQLLAAYRPYASAAALVREGLTQQDTAALQEATALIDEGSSLVPAATEAIQAAAGV